MAEDWRVTANLHEPDGGRLIRALHSAEVEGEARRQLAGRVAVSGQDSHVFLYADTETAARSARDVVAAVLEEHGIAADLTIDRWHHDEERWEDASSPMPSTATEHHAEHEKLESDEEAESEASDVAAWEVRVELSSHHEAHALAERLEAEGVTCVRRWKYVLVGAGDEDDANALASRLQAEAPAAATVHVEPGSGLAWQLQPGNPFAIFGGLAG
ncbi:MAG TPA: hypothetical protein VGL76_02000 [Gaiellaceae bacterium]